MEDVTNHAQFLKDQGITFVKQLHYDSNRPESTFQIRRDASIIEAWIGRRFEDFSVPDFEKIGLAWITYLSRGKAPSEQLKDSFLHYASDLNTVEPIGNVPSDVFSVFDRMLHFESSPDTIHADLKPPNVPRQINWWRRRSRFFWVTVFFFAVWFVLVFVWAMFFDPFDVGEWEYTDPEERLRVLMIALAPLIGVQLYLIYSKWMK